MTRILGVDPGTRVVGYGMVERGDRLNPIELRYIECGIIQAPVQRPMYERLHVIARTLSDVIAEHAPDEVAIETAFYGRNASSALKLGQARGAIMLVVAQHGLILGEYAPAQIKQVVVGHGRATKLDVQQRIQMLLRLRRPPATDAADALAVAVCHGTSGRDVSR